MSNQKKSAYQGAPQGGDTNFRKEWDTQEYAQKAKEREAEVKRKAQNEGPNKDKSINMKQGGLAVAREESLQLEANLNKTVVITAQDELDFPSLYFGVDFQSTFVKAYDQAKGPGFHCQICNVTYRDNLAYLDHLNSPLHLRNSGVSNRVARSTLDQVKARVEARKLKDKAPIDPKITFEERLKREEFEKLQKKQAKKERKALDKGKEIVVDEQAMAMMGFGAFGSSKGI